MIPSVLRNFNVFLNGTSYAGRVSEAELPELNIKTEELRNGGMDGTAEIDMGMEAMEAKLTFSEYTPEVIKTFGRMNGNATRITLRGALQRDNEPAVACVVELGGGVKSLGMGTWKAGDMASNEITMAVRYYRLVIGGEQLLEIDVENMIRRIGPVDELESIRQAIGL